MTLVGLNDRPLGPYSKHIIFFISYGFNKLECLFPGKPFQLSLMFDRYKQSRLMGLFEGHGENKVLAASFYMLNWVI